METIIIVLGCTVFFGSLGGYRYHKRRMREMENQWETALQSVTERITKYCEVLTLQLTTNVGIHQVIFKTCKELHKTNPQACAVVSGYFNNIDLFVSNEMHAVISGSKQEYHPLVEKVYADALSISEEYLIDNCPEDMPGFSDFSIQGLERRRGIHLAGLVNNIVLKTVTTNLNQNMRIKREVC